MATTFDEKGKFFTPIISKNPVDVIIQTVTHRIAGKIYVRPEERIKDELDRNEDFLAVTDAVITDLNGDEVAVAKFLTINRNQIVWVLPEDDIINKSK